jgi:DNA-binding NarL/FixJ family response regulator
MIPRQRIVRERRQYNQWVATETLEDYALRFTAGRARISRGKSNREIGEILSISPRTVNKHLEQVFVKLGVENRAAAAARAVGCLM